MNVTEAYKPGHPEKGGDGGTGEGHDGQGKMVRWCAVKAKAMQGLQSHRRSWDN